MNKLVKGIGTYTKGRFKSKINNKSTKVYSAWVNMLTRCYEKSYQDKNPTYVGCYISDNFKNFQYFAEWCSTQKGFDKQDFHLDKDLLLKGNKEYSEHTCVFVPVEINNFVTKRNSMRGEHLIGVRYEVRGNKFRADFSKGSNILHLGTFMCEEAAFYAYKFAKEDYAKELATKYKGLVDDSVVIALNNYCVDITD